MAHPQGRIFVSAASQETPVLTRQQGDQIKPEVTKKTIYLNLSVYVREGVTNFEVPIYCYDGALGPKEVEKINDEGVVFRSAWESR